MKATVEALKRELAKLRASVAGRLSRNAALSGARERSLMTGCRPGWCGCSRGAPAMTHCIETTTVAVRPDLDLNAVE
jgi:hypothetical protein